MLSAVSKRLGELSGTLIDPIWKRVLALSWGGRFLVFLLMLGSVAAYTRPDQVVLVENYASAFARVVWAGDSAIPLPEPVIAQVRDTAEQIAASLDFYRLGYEPSTFSWSIA